VGVDPAPAAQTAAGQALPAPGAPASIQVSGARGAFSVTLDPAPNAAQLAGYFVESASDAAFTQPTVYSLGNTLVASLALGNVTRYWRARAKNPDSDYGPYAYFGAQASPTAVVGGLLGSSDLDPNVAVNQTNFATVDSIDAGGSATVRICGPGGVGSSWTRQLGSATQTFPAGAITGLAYSTPYWVVWNGAAYLALTSFAASLADGLVQVGSLTTIASGGSGGTTGGGGNSGGGGGGGGKPPFTD